jgi:hypothetical protein
MERIIYRVSVYISCGTFLLTCHCPWECTILRQLGTHLSCTCEELCTVFNKFRSTAINCPRSLPILYCQKKLFCTLQRIYSSVAILPDYLVRKSLQFRRGLFCSVQASGFQLCKKICCDCKTLIAQFKLQNYHQKTATILGSAQFYSNNYNVHSRIQLHWKSLYRKETTKDSSQIYFLF